MVLLQGWMRCDALELTSTVEDHAAGPGQVVLLKALLVDGLLGNDVAGAEEDGGGDGLGEEGPLDQLGLVPLCVCE